MSTVLIEILIVLQKTAAIRQRGLLSQMGFAAKTDRYSVLLVRNIMRTG